MCLPLQVWMLVQRKWMYLESIFIGSDDIRNQLPQEAKRFDTIDKTWLKIMADTAKNTNVLDACSIDGRCVHWSACASSLSIA
jgi:dynein heavy chain